MSEDNDFVDWCQRNNLQINAAKTKELVVDFRRCSHSLPTPVNIQGMDMREWTLDVHPSNKLDWTVNTDALYKKGQSRLYMLRRSFGVQGALLKTFFDTVVASEWCAGAAAFPSLTGRDWTS